MFSRTLEISLNHAFMQARDKRHEFITVEHLLLALLENPEACLALSACGANIDRLRAGLGIFIDETTPHVPMNVERDIQPTLSFQRILQRAIYQIQSSGNSEVNGMNVLLAIFGEQDSQAVYFLNQENVTRVDVVNYSTQGVSKPQKEEPNYFSEDPMQSDTIMPQDSPDGSVVEQCTVNLNEKAMSGKIDPVVGREYELSRCVQILCRRSKNNPLFVGEAGVGKTAIAEGLAQLIVNKKVPKVLANTTVYSLDLATLLSGTKYRGDFEKRFKSVLNALSRHTGAIVFIDEIHNLVGAGSATGGTMDAANLIKPMLSSGDIRCMGATTYDEYRNFISKDQALLRRFQKIDIEEPSPEEAQKILLGLQSYFEEFHNIKYTDEALSRAVELSSRYMMDRHLPDKAIDVIDEAGAYQALQSDAKRKDTIDVKEIEEVIAKMARIPMQSVSSSTVSMLKQLPSRLKQLVLGQDGAVDTLIDAIKLSRSGLRDKNKPIGSFLMAGPTGVGKTELTRQLAAELDVDLLRFDMSEYMEKHAVSRLIGAPPGYVGYDQGGLLTEEVIKKPHAVLLLDEIEKAHPDMFNILLQIMDYGQLTDSNGRKADFKHVIIVMTSNVGADVLDKQSIGFSEGRDEEDGVAAMSQVFSPEFRNRLDAFVQFKHLQPSVMIDIVDKELESLRTQLAENTITLEVTPQACQWLAENGYDRKMGARPLQRLIQEKIRKPLADELLFGSLANGGAVVNVSVEKGQLQIQHEVVAV